MSRRILFVGGTTGGGVATINNEVTRVFRQAGWRCDHVDTEAWKARFPAPMAYLVAYFQTVIAIIGRRPGTVYLQLAQTGYLHQSLFLLWAKLLGRRTIAHFHAKADVKGTTTPRQFRQILFSRRYTDELILLTEPCRRGLVAHGWTGGAHVVPNFINTLGLPAILSPVADRKPILYLGRMDREKGIFEIIEVARHLPDEEFIFVGNFADKDQERQFKTGLATAPNARWLGPQYGDGKYEIIARSRFLLFPTWRDEFPMTLIEATILGCIPIVTPVGSVGEIIRDGFNGVFIQPGDVDGMVSMINTLQARGDLQTMADNGVAFARAHFTSEAARDRLLAIVG
jgi:glycosyltransferase involved in cell wall biosynthesis